MPKVIAPSQRMIILQHYWRSKYDKHNIAKYNGVSERYIRILDKRFENTNTVLTEHESSRANIKNFKRTNKSSVLCEEDEEK